MTSQAELANRKANLSDAKRRLLEQRLASRATASAPAPPTIEPRPADAPALASFAQERLWFLQQLDENSVAYNMHNAMRFQGTVDVAALHGALNAVVQRHEILRTTFVEQEGQVYQQIAPTLSIDLPLTDLQRTPDPEAAAQQLAIVQGRQPFNLAEGPLLRTHLLQLNGDAYLLLLTMHHIVSDEWSMNAFWRELASHYQSLCAGATPHLSPLPLQYADFAHWQRNRLEEGQLTHELAFWQRQLADAPRLLQLPTDRPRPAVQRYAGGLLSRSLPANLTNALQKLSRQYDTTLFATLLTAFYVLLHRYSQQHDILVGTPIANRGYAELEEMIGFFLNTVVLRTHLQDQQSFVALLTQVKESTLAALAHQELPFERLVEALHPQRDPSYNPLFQVMFVMQSDQTQALNFPALTLTPHRFDSGVSKFDLTLFVNQRGDQLAAAIEYNSALFEAATVERMLGHWQTLLEAIVANPEERISHLPLLTAAEQQQLLVEWNSTAAAYPQERCIHHLIEMQATQQPNAPAVVCQDQQLTYGALNQRANLLARQLQAEGIRPGTFVGLCVERSLEMLIGILAIHKAGGAYLPLDPSYPVQRLAFMLADTRAPIILTQKKLLGSIPATSAQLITIDALDFGAARALHGDDVSSDVGPHDPAYIIYTSGSTGMPKGVVVRHRNLVHSTTARFGYFKHQVQRFLLLSSFAFDSSLVGIFWTLCQGGTLILPAQGDEQNGAHLLTLMAQHQVTHMLTLPSLYDLLLEAQRGELASLTTAIVAGEACLPSLVDAHFKALPQTALYNEYGPTEGTVWSTVYQMHPNDGHKSIPIGKPIPNMQTYILDGHRQPVPLGVPGELYICGAGVAQGYLNRPELTAERFIDRAAFRFFDQIGTDNAPQPMGTNGKLYRTGDLVRYLADGNIEFLGRVDHQVKIRGFRIELGEIEQAIARHDLVDEVVVTAQRNEGAATRLVAYVTSHSNKLNAAQLHSFLRERLPDYMIPSAWLLLDDLARTPNGKIDRARLPEPSTLPTAIDAVQTPPQDELEIQLMTIWTNVLQLPQVGLHSNYFELGGHSLQAMRLFHQIRQKLGRDLPLATLFQAPTISEQAALLRKEGWQPTWSSLVPIQPRGRKRPFFCMHAVGGNVLSLAALAEHLGPSQPFYALQSQGLDGKQTIPATVQEMAAYYLDEIRTVQPQGPYLLSGQSSGGLVAFEAARQLHAQGEEVALLALIDSYAPPPRAHESHHIAPTIPITKRLAFHLQKLSKAGKSHLQASVRRRFVLAQLGAKRAAENALVTFARRYYTTRGEPLPPRYRPTAVRTATETALRSYEPSLYEGPITLFRATQSIDAYLEDIYGSQGGWDRLTTAGVAVYDIEGGHNLEQEPQVGEVAAILTQLIG